MQAGESVAVQADDPRRRFRYGRRYRFSANQQRESAQDTEAQDLGQAGGRNQVQIVGGCDSTARRSRATRHILEARILAIGMQRGRGQRCASADLDERQDLTHVDCRCLQARNYRK